MKIKCFVSSNIFILLGSGMIALSPIEAMASNNKTWGSRIAPYGQGTLLRFYPQDPSVDTTKTTLENTESAFFPQIFGDGPSDFDMQIAENPVTASRFELAKPGTAAFDSMHTFAVVRDTFNMWRGGLEDILSSYNDPAVKKIATTWDSRPHGILHIYPYGIANEQNAFYSRESQNPLLPGCELRFGYFKTSLLKTFYTCQSSDIVAHEAGHAALDRMRPKFYESDKLETGALHEATGDITAFFSLVRNDTIAQSLISSTKGNLHDKNNFAAQLAEGFGQAIGMGSALRNMDGDYMYANLQNEVHDKAQFLSSIAYDVVANTFLKGYNQQIMKNPNPTNFLQDISRYAFLQYIHALATVPSDEPSFTDIGKQIIKLQNETYSSKAPGTLPSALKDMDWKNAWETGFTQRGLSLSSNNTKIQRHAMGNKGACCMQHRLKKSSAAADHINEE